MLAELSRVLDSVYRLGFDSGSTRYNPRMMIDDVLGPVDYQETGRGRTLVFVPGSCSTGSSWKSVIAHLDGRFRAITTSLPGYGGSAERRTSSDKSIGLIAAAIEAVIAQAGTPVDLVGHSFGGEVGLAVALRGRVRLTSLTILEDPAPSMLSTFHRNEYYDQFRAMTSAYIDDYASGNAEAIASMIDFYGGAGTFKSWPPAVRDYAVKTTPTNIFDWESAYAFRPNPTTLAELSLPVLVAVGENSHPAVIEANALIARAIPQATFTTIGGAAHFMTATHAREIASLIERHVLSIQ